MNMKIQFRWMYRVDLPEVIRIEIASFKHPWAKHDFTRLLSHEHIYGLVAHIDGEIVAYMIYEATDECINIINMAVDPSYRRLKIGAALVDKLVRKAYHKHSRLITKVWERNLPAQLFFKSLGFCLNTIEREAWDGDFGKEDSYVMLYSNPVDEAKIEDEKCSGVC
jgi:[ribosomal protein S18]-alanine N-acetyltransferase